MMYSSRHRQTVLLLLAALLLRAGIPDGYMPAALGSGQLFELCPAGVPAGFMQALSGSGHHHHGDSAASEAHYDASQCPIGHLLSAAAAVDDSWQSNSAPDLPVFIDQPTLRLVSRAPTNHRSRGPPA